MLIYVNIKQHSFLVK